MDIQEIFYFTATIVMVLAMLFMLGMLGLLFYIKKKISELDNYGKKVIQKADYFVEGVKNNIKTVTDIRSAIFRRDHKKTY